MWVTAQIPPEWEALLLSIENLHIAWYVTHRQILHRWKYSVCFCLADLTWFDFIVLLNAKTTSACNYDGLKIQVLDRSFPLFFPVFWPLPVMIFLILLRLNMSQTLTLHFGKLWPSVLITEYCTKNFTHKVWEFYITIWI